MAVQVFCRSNSQLTGLWLADTVLSKGRLYPMGLTVASSAIQALQARAEHLAGFPKVSQLKKSVELPAGWVPKAGWLKTKVQMGK